MGSNDLVHDLSDDRSNDLVHDLDQRWDAAMAEHRLYGGCSDDAPPPPQDSLAAILRDRASIAEVVAAMLNDAAEMLDEAEGIAADIFRYLDDRRIYSPRP